MVNGKTKLGGYSAETVGYLRRENDLPLYRDYDDIRNCKMAEPTYPRDIIVAIKLNLTLDARGTSMENVLPEFLGFNIVEGKLDMFVDRVFRK